MWLVAIIVDMKPTVYMLCGLPGSGKSTHAQKLAAEGLLKLSPDEEVYARFGRAGINYPKDQFLKYYETVLADLEKEISALLKQNRSFILDYGYWRKSHREKHRILIERYNATWKLLYFKASNELLTERLEKRNKRQDANAFPVTIEMLRDSIERFEEPYNEGEIVVEQSHSN